MFRLSRRSAELSIGMFLFVLLVPDFLSLSFQVRLTRHDISSTVSAAVHPSSEFNFMPESVFNRKSDLKPELGRLSGEHRPAAAVRYCRAVFCTVCTASVHHLHASWLDVRPLLHTSAKKHPASESTRTKPDIVRSSTGTHRPDAA